MYDIFVRVKAVVRQGDRYLMLKQWLDDRIVDPYVWGFIDCELERGESPDDAVLRAVHEAVGVDAVIEKPLYTWSQMMGDVQCIGIAYLCHLSEEGDSISLSDDYCEFEWVAKQDFASYIDNKNVWKDIVRTIGEI